MVCLLLLGWQRNSGQSCQSCNLVKKGISMKYALSLLISVTLFFLIPLILGDTFFKGTMVGDAFTTIAFFTFDFTFDHLGVENF